MSLNSGRNMKVFVEQTYQYSSSYGAERWLVGMLCIFDSLCSSGVESDQKHMAKVFNKIKAHL